MILRNISSVFSIQQTQVVPGLELQDLLQLSDIPDVEDAASVRPKRRVAPVDFFAGLPGGRVEKGVFFPLHLIPSYHLRVRV